MHKYGEVIIEIFSVSFFCIDKKKNGNIIQHIYNTGLNHDDWSEAMALFWYAK